MIPMNYILLVGYLTNSSNPMYFGLSGCGGDAGYFVGVMDDVRKQIVINDTIIIVVNFSSAVIILGHLSSSLRHFNVNSF